MRVLASSVQDLVVQMALVNQNQALTKEIQEDIKHLERVVVSMDRRLIKISGLNGDNGQVSELASRVDEQDIKLSGLMLSRAALAGYAAASASAGAAIAKFLI